MPRRLSLAHKFFAAYFVITGTALAFAGVAGYIQFLRHFTREADASLERQAHLLAEAFRPLLEAPSPDLALVAREGDRIGKGLSTRITVVLPDGRVAADSRVGAGGLGGLEDHSERPEVRAALEGEVGTATRRSGSLNEEHRYCAVPVRSGGRIVGVVRTALPTADLARGLRRIRTITFGTGIAAFALMLLFTAMRARRIAGPLEEMRAAAREITSGNLGRRVHVRTGDELEEMAEALNRTASHLGETIRTLERGKARLSILLDRLSDGVLVVGDDRTVRLMNPKAEVLLGASPGIREGKTYAELIRHPEVVAAIDRARREGGAPPGEVTLHLPAGDRVVRLAATPVRHEAEGRTDLLVTLTDVTEEKRLARIKSDFVSNASHELRTPLTNIRGYLEAMEDAVREGKPVDPAFLAVTVANAERMGALIDDLLELSKAESAAGPVQKEEVPLPAFLERVAAPHREAAARAGKTLAVAAGEGTLRADAGKLALAVSNVVDNAVKHGREGGTITLSGRRSDGGVLIEVADDGPGISPEHLPRIFERFYRVDKGRSRDLGGTGLGLSIARHIVESQGGTIQVESRPGIGTRFAVRIPD